MRTRLIAILLAGLAMCAPGWAQAFVELKQDSTKYNLRATNGMPISSTVGVPVGSNGKAPGPNPGPVGTVNQFQGLITFGGGVVPVPSGLGAGTFVANAETLNLPRAKVNNQPNNAIQVVLKSARVGSPVLSRSVSFLFGATIPVPEVDEYGVLLKIVNTTVTPNRPITEPEAYWAAEPYSSNNHTNKNYYWSPHHLKVFAVAPGPLDIVWRKAVSSTPQGTPANVSTVTIAGAPYTLLTKRYVISGSPVKQPRQMYWTVGDFTKIGKPIVVPPARVQRVQVAYSESHFPIRVATAYPQSTVIEPDPNLRLDEKRTLWYDPTLGTINAYNIEGRAFVELLGDLRDDQVTHVPIGFEIVDVIREPKPEDVSIELGELITAYQNDDPDDSGLFPEPIQHGTDVFAFQHNIPGTDEMEFFAVRKTLNQNDLQVHWMEEGIAGLRWPARFVRYALDWPKDVAKYSHYIRPKVANDAEARVTAVQLPTDNAPFVQYQDPLDTVRGKLTEQFKYYTFLTPSYPAHRALLRFAAGEHIRFERVFSWLDERLRSGDFTGTPATELSSWDAVSKTFDWPDDFVTPRLYESFAFVGDRILAPVGEEGAGFGDYLAGHIVQKSGDSFHPGAYRDPLAVGFEDANKGAIIPVNSIPDDNVLEIMWFRKNGVNLAQGFRSTYWPEVISKYVIEWPVGGAEIVLASNDGSGPLQSLQAKGSIYYQNDSTLPGYNPNEEHAIMQGGQAFALRDDLNVMAQPGYSSHPYVLLDYTESDGRPAMRVFAVTREKPDDGIVFNFKIQAGTILQPPMPLPLLDKPFAPKVVGQPFKSLNVEFSSWLVDASALNNASQTILTLNTTPVFPAHVVLALQNGANVRWIYVTSVATETKKAIGYTANVEPNEVAKWSASAQPVNLTRWKYNVLRGSPPVVNDPVIVANPVKRVTWKGTVVEAGTEGSANYVVVQFTGNRPPLAEEAPVLLRLAPQAAFLSWQLLAEPIPAITDAGVRSVYSSFTFQDRKGNQWVYRGPHEGVTRPLFAQFYYRTLPGFYFPGEATQPPVGTITPYLRPQRDDGTYAGNAVYGNSNADQSGDGNSLPITYEPVWPDNTPTLQMAETLTTPKRGLPAVRGQTSMEVYYQQSFVKGGLASPSVILHDPTREKRYSLGEPSSTTRLKAIPGSVATSNYRGKTYFPKLPPHLSERFFVDPNRGANGALVLKGLFVDPGLGDTFLHLNVLSASDVATLKGLCLSGDTDQSKWNTAIDNLTTDMELFIEDNARPGTYKPDASKTVTVGSTGIAAVNDDDVAVDSYALTAVGPGTGYVVLISGNGRAFTPEADPVSVHVIRVTDTLYRGEVNIVESANPLNEKLIMQQVVDLAGKAEDFNFEWKIASPVDGLPPAVYQNTAVTLMAAGQAWSHIPFPTDKDSVGRLSRVSAARINQDVVSTVTPVSIVSLDATAQDGARYTLVGNNANNLVAGNSLVLRGGDGTEVDVVILSIAGNQYTVERIAGELDVLPPDDVVQVYERSIAGKVQSIAFQNFTASATANYAQLWMSLNIESGLGARVYIDGQLFAKLNTGEDETPQNSPPEGLSPLSRAYLLSPAALAGGKPVAGGQKIHQVQVEFLSQATPGTALPFALKIEATEAVDVTAQQWLPMDKETRYPDGVRAILGGTADVRSLADNYLIMRYQAKNNTHASWQSDPNDPTKNIAWSQWTSPQLAEGWIKRVLKGINPFNQRIQDLFNNQVNTDVSLVQQAGPRWEGDVALNLESINDFGLIEIYETVLNRGKMLSIGGGINYGPANDALLLAAGYLNDLYMILGNEAWADAANPTIGIGTKDNTYGEIATALFAFRGQLPSLLEEELALLRGRDDFLLPGVELRPLYNRLTWNYTRGIDAGEVIYALNYNILDQNTDGKVDASDARELFPQGHGDAYGHYLTALKGYYTLLLDDNFDWVPRIEAVTVLGKPVSVDYQDERKFAAAAASLARAGKQVFDLTWRRDYKSGSGAGWQHLSQTKVNSNTRNLTTTRYWGADHWASRVGQGTFLNWVVGNGILPDVDPDPSHTGSIQQVDRTTVPELRELSAVGEAIQIGLENAEGGLTPLGISQNALPFDINPLSIGNGTDTSHYEQIYKRAKDALNNAMVAFDDAKDVTRLMRSEQDSLADLRADVAEQEFTYNSALVDIYGTPYPEDIGPGKPFPAGFDGPDLVHYMYVDNKELNFGSLLKPAEDTLWRIDVQSFKTDWLKSGEIMSIAGLPLKAADDDRISDFSFITKARAYPNDGIADPNNPVYLTNRTLFVEYNLSSHGFFRKPATYIGRRASPGQLQQAISEIIQARNSAYEAFYNADAAKFDLDWAILSLERKIDSHSHIRGLEATKYSLDRILSAVKLGVEIGDKILEATKEQISGVTKTAAKSLPTMFVAGLAAGGDLTAPARGVLEGTGVTFESVTEWKKVITFSVIKALEQANEIQKSSIDLAIADEAWKQELRDATGELRDKVYGMQNQFTAINAALQQLDDAQRNYRKLLADGERIQTEREVFRQRSAAVIQGFRTRDAAFRIFRNEKLERYKTLFDMASQYTFMAAQAYDYETGLLHTQEGKDFINRIIRSRALGVVIDGNPQFAGSNLGDPGLSSVLAEMNADYAVLRGRLGFKNPDAYGTVLSLRTENFRIKTGADGDANWTDVLNNGYKENLLDDADVRRYCLRIDAGNGLPVPGIVLEFSTTIADGVNFFGRPLAPGDHAFSPASFATKIFAVGVALEGYKGMDDPQANGSAVSDSGAASPVDPDLTFLDPDALAANPYVYLIPVGLDSMRSPPLGDAGVVRTWAVEDIAIPLPFNIGASSYSTQRPWQSASSLTEPLFGLRKHQPFRPVSSANIFGTLLVWWTGGELERTAYANTRLIGRSAWNSKWKLVIPGRTLLSDPQEGLDRFMRSVKDVKLYYHTYSYSGN